MRLSLRFVVPLLLALGAFAYIAVPLADALMLRWFVRDLDIRSSLIASTVAGAAVGPDPDRVDAADRQLSSTGCCRTSGSTPSGCASTSATRRSPRASFRRRSAAPRSRPTPTPAQRTAALDARPAAPRGSPRRQRRHAGRAAGARPRHELRRAAQRGDAALPVLLLRRARRVHRADHRRHRAAVVARLGARPARAAARRGHPAAGAVDARRRSCARSRATCAS